MFFFEKKNQKTFIFMAFGAGEARNSATKVFCFFSSEKKTSFLCLDAGRAGALYNTD